MITKAVYDDHYRVDLYLVTDCAFDEFCEHVEDTFDHEIENDLLDGNHKTGYALVIPRAGDDDLYCLWVEHRRDYLTLAHESLHLTGYILNCKCVTYDPENNEPYAYLQEWIMEKFIRMRNGRVKKQES